MKKIFQVKNAIWLGCILFLIHSCNTNKDSNYEGTIRPLHGPDEVWINIGGEPDYLDPNKIGGAIESNVSNNMFVRLTQINPKTGEAIPDLARSWDISKDRMDYVFHLRQDAQWSDGTPLTAYDVEYSWKRLIDPKTAGAMSSMADVIENAREYRSGKKKKDQVSVKAIDDHTLKVHLNSPVSYFLSLIENIIFAPLPSHVIEKLKTNGKEDDWIKPENIVVSGPFKLVEDHFKQYKVFEKNPNYYEASQVKLNRVKTFIINGYQADLNSYRTGHHDWSCCTNVPIEEIANLKQKKDFSIAPYFSTSFLMLNVTKKPFDNKLVRQALSLAIDRKSLVENILRAGQIPTRDFVPIGTDDYPGIRSEIYNPELAKKLLASAGFPDGKGFPKFSIKFNSGEIHKYTAEAVQQILKKNLNVEVELLNEEWSVFLQDQKSGNYEIVRRSWIGDYLDPHSFLSVLLSDSTTNRSGWKNKEYDQLIAKSNVESEKSKRFEYFKKAEKILADEQPYIPLYFYTLPYLKKPYLKGFWPNLQDRHEWKYMWIDDRWYKGVPENPDILDEPWQSKD